MDKRSIKTHKNIKLSFLNILKRKDLSSITITELCNDCKIHRKTFYAHFRNTADILDEIYDELIQDIEQLYKNILKKKYITFEEIFQKINTYFTENLEIYQLLLQGRHCAIFVTKILNYFNSNFTEINEKNRESITNKYTFYFCLSGITSLYVYYLQNCSIVSITDIANTCVKICKKTFKI